MGVPVDGGLFAQGLKSISHEVLTHFDVLGHVEVDGLEKIVEDVEHRGGQRSHSKVVLKMKIMKIKLYVSKVATSAVWGMSNVRSGRGCSFLTRIPNKKIKLF
jgi:hypothetical protein